MPTQVISSKTIADVVESLIAAYYLFGSDAAAPHAQHLRSIRTANRNVGPRAPTLAPTTRTVSIRIPIIPQRDESGGLLHGVRLSSLLVALVTREQTSVSPRLQVAGIPHHGLRRLC